MRIVKIKKRRNEYRTIYVPSREEKKELKAILAELEKLECAYSPFAHGFVSGRNIITNATQHVGFLVTLSFDLKDFFDSVTHLGFHKNDVWEKLYPISAEAFQKSMELCFPDGAARQGLPTSPCLSNIASFDMDFEIYEKVKFIVKDFVFTRYADDITISINRINSDIISRIQSVVRETVEKYGFKENERKRRVQFASMGRREVCGLMVDDKVYVSRHFRRRLRAAKHRLSQNPDNGKQKQIVRGMLEFSKLKLPGKKSEPAIESASTSRNVSLGESDVVANTENLSGSTRTTSLEERMPCYET